MGGTRRALALAALLVLSCAATAGAATAHSPRITFYFGLKRPEAAARTAFFAVQQPGSFTYRRFLSRRRVAALYGASATTRARFVRLARGEGFSATIDRSGVFARVSGSVARFERVFKARIRQSAGDVGHSYTPARPLTIPRAMRPLIRDVVPIFNRQYTHPPKSGPAVARAARKPPPKRTGTFKHGCRAARKTGAFSYAQVRHAYGIDRLGNGRGASIAILGLDERPTAGDITDNARCFGYPKLRSKLLLTDGMHSSPRGLFEPQEDLALARGMAPAASLTFTQAWSGAAMWFLGASQVLDSRHLPDSLSISYGICENDVRGHGTGANRASRAGANLLDSIFIRLGLAGVGTYASAGDDGSSCNGLHFSGVAWPGSSAYVTTVGGTRLTLTRANERRNEVVWNDLGFKGGLGASGGGFAHYSWRPPFQYGLGLPGRRRTVPDVSAAASNFPGWPIVLGGHWVVDGGTSAAAPLVASAMAVISARLQRRHLPPIGPAAGLFYYLARVHPSALWDVIHGNNGFFAKVPARYAKRGYDLASGLGVPRFARVAADVPAPAW